MRVALATCRDLPDWEVDDRALHAALAARGAEVVRPAWDDPGFTWEGCDGCLIRTTWDYMERRDAYVGWAERVESLIPLFNPAAVVRWNTHKRYLEELAAAGLPTVPTVWLPRGEGVDLADALATRGWRGGFLKPAVGATARETLPFAADPPGLAAAAAHLERTLPREDMMLQPFLERVRTEGELSAVWIDGAITHAVRKLPVPGDYRVQDDFGASDESVAVDDELRELTRRALEAVGFELLYARVDLLRDDAGRLRLTELELVEPSLFFRHGPHAAERLAEGLLRRVRGGSLRPSTAGE